MVPAIPTLSIKLYDTLSTVPSVGMRRDDMATVEQAILMNYPAKYPSSLLTASDGDLESRK